MILRRTLQLKFCQVIFNKIPLHYFTSYNGNSTSTSSWNVQFLGRHSASVIFSRNPTSTKAFQQIPTQHEYKLKPLHYTTKPQNQNSIPIPARGSSQFFSNLIPTRTPTKHRKPSLPLPPPHPMHPIAPFNCLKKQSAICSGASLSLFLSLSRARFWGSFVCAPGNCARRAIYARFFPLRWLTQSSEPKRASKIKSENYRCGHGGRRLMHLAILCAL